MNDGKIKQGLDNNYNIAMIKAYVDKEEEPKRELWYEKIFLRYQKKDG